MSRYIDIPRGAVVSVLQPGATTPRYYKAPDTLGTSYWTRADENSPWEPTSGIDIWKRVSAAKDAIKLDPEDMMATDPLSKSPNYPVIVVHLDDGNGLTICSRKPMPDPSAPIHADVPRYFCQGCAQSVNAP